MKSALAVLGTVAIVAGLLAGNAIAPFVGASSHREAVVISQDPAADITDFYLFRAPDNPNAVVAVMNTWPFETPEGGPTWYLFDDAVRYSIHFSRDGGATEDVRLDFRFRTEIRNPNTALLNTGPIANLNDPNWNLRQFYSVDLVVAGGPPTRLATDLPVPPPNIGPKSTPNYDALANAAIQNLLFPVGGPGKVFAGPRDDPFFIDLGATFDLLTIRPGAPGNAGGGIDQIAGLNVQSIVVQIPFQAVVSPICQLNNPSDATCVIGAWSTTSRPTTQVFNPDGTVTNGAGFVQVSRLANPLVNELVIPYPQKDRFNATPPSGDGQFLPFVLDPEPARLLTLLYGIATPPAPRNDLVSIFLTGISGLNQPPGVVPSEMMRLNVAVPISASPNGLGVLGGDSQGYPNGRRLADDVVDITLQAAAGATPLTPLFGRPPNNQLGDGVNQNEKPFSNTFPYVASPHQGFDHTHHRLEPRTAPRTGFTPGTPTPTPTPTARPTQVAIVVPPPIPPPPPLLLPPAPPPPLLPPPPRPAGAPRGPMMPEVPVIPEADTLVLFGVGLALVGGFAAWRRTRGGR